MIRLRCFGYRLFCCWTRAPLHDSKFKCDGALEMEWPFGDNGIISIYWIRRSPELLVHQVQERYFCFEVIALRLVEKRQIFFVLGRDPNITIITVVACGALGDCTLKISSGWAASSVPSQTMATAVSGSPKRAAPRPFRGGGKPEAY